jgi:G protein beta subunit-like protein
VKEFYHSNFVNSLAIANNNRDLIAADENGTIKIWDINKGEVRTEYNSNLEDEGISFRSVAVSDTEGFLIGAKSSGVCCVFDYGYNRDLKLINTFEAHKTYITKCVLSPENNLLATCSADTEIRVFERVEKETKDFNLKTRFVGHKKWVWDCEFSLDSKYLISCSSDKSIRVWSLDQGKPLSNLMNPKGVNHIALVDDDSE